MSEELSKWPKKTKKRRRVMRIGVVTMSRSNHLIVTEGKEGNGQLSVLAVKSGDKRERGGRKRKVKVRCVWVVDG